MSFVQPPFPQWTNFTAAQRKPMLIPSGYFSPNDNISFIWAPSSSGGSSGTPTALTGTINGINTVFTCPVTIINYINVYLNGLFQTPGTSYTLVSQTITFATAPQTGDSLYAVSF